MKDRRQLEVHQREIVIVSNLTIYITLNLIQISAIFTVKKATENLVKMNAGFCKADSDNLPRVDMDMVLQFYVANIHYFSAEMKNIKTLR